MLCFVKGYKRSAYAQWELEDDYIHLGFHDFPYVNNERSLLNVTYVCNVRNFVPGIYRKSLRYRKKETRHSFEEGLMTFASRFLV